MHTSRKDFLTQDSVSLIEILEKQASLSPDRIIYRFISDGQHISELSYEQLILDAKRIASYLQDCTQNGDRILLIYPPGLDYIKAFFGVVYSGRLAVPVYPPVKPEFVRSLQSIIDDCSPTAVLSNTQVISQIRKLKLFKAMTKLPWICRIAEKLSRGGADLIEWDFDAFHWINTDKIQSYPIRENLPNIHVSDYAFLQYTSGSTGNPKGVCLSHDNIFHNQKLSHQAFGTHYDTEIVSWLPPYHDMGLIGSILHACYVGCISTCMSPSYFLNDPFNWLKAISDSQNCVSGGPNFSYNLCVSRISEEKKQLLDLSNWQVAFCGSEPINRKVLDGFSEYFGSCGFNKTAFLPCYGLAEATLFVSGHKSLTVLNKSELDVDNEDFILPEQIVSCGKPYQPLKILDVHDRTEVVFGTIGEIALSGLCITNNYWHKQNDPEHFIYIDNNRFFLTGDLGFLKNNELFIVGRKKETIIIAGRNYFPQDMEHQLHYQIDELKKGGCAIVGVNERDTDRLVIVAEVKKHYNNFNEIILKIKKVLAVEFNLFVNSIFLIAEKTLPKTTSGKIKRAQIKNAVLQKKLDSLIEHHFEDAPEVVNEHPLLTIVKDLIALPENEQVDTSKTLMELGIDSLMYIELQARFEDNYPKYKGKIDFSALAHVTNLKAAMEAIDRIEG